MLGFRHFLRRLVFVSIPSDERMEIGKSFGMLIDSDTYIQEGKIPVRMDESGKVLESGKPRETREFNGKTYLMETALTGDVAILRAWKVDEAGNCVFR